MGRLIINNKLIIECDDAKKRKEEDIDLNKKQKKIFLFLKMLMLIIIWLIVFFYHPIWFVIIMTIVSMSIIGTKATFVKEVEVKQK